MNESYDGFLSSKAIRATPSGMADIPQLPAALKPFQRAITEWALRRGRAALFEGTGLGKTIQQLSWARAVADHEQGSVLILTPLAVAEQTCEEARKFNIPGVAYARDRWSVRGDIVVTNYERFEKFDIEDFAGIVLDESGIIKSHDGETRRMLSEACSGLRWRLCCTATPAPNDYAELGQHAEFLGVMRAAEMLSMFFVHDGSIRAGGGTTQEWRLKRHAEHDFWRWIASWAVVIQNPADLGFDEPGYTLPELRHHQVDAAADYRPVAGKLFPMEASTLAERIAVRRETIERRVAAALDIIVREIEEPWLIWCHLNSEADAIEALLPSAMQVAGRDQADLKVARLRGFAKGCPLHLISKPSIAGHGMNWQHCARMVFVGLTDSFEEIFQATRRCWRFGQTKPVDVYLVASELEGAVVANLRRKEADYAAMLSNMADHMRDLTQESVFGHPKTAGHYEPQLAMRLPTWML